jgi:hypothetical protein
MYKTFSDLAHSLNEPYNSSFQLKLAFKLFQEEMGHSNQDSLKKPFNIAKMRNSHELIMLRRNDKACV